MPMNQNTKGMDSTANSERRNHAGLSWERERKFPKKPFVVWAVIVSAGRDWIAKNSAVITHKNDTIWTIREVIAPARKKSPTMPATTKINGKAPVLDSFGPLQSKKFHSAPKNPAPQQITATDAAQPMIRRIGRNQFL